MCSQHYLGSWTFVLLKAMCLFLDLFSFLSNSYRYRDVCIQFSFFFKLSEFVAIFIIFTIAKL